MFYWTSTESGRSRGTHQCSFTSPSERCSFLPNKEGEARCAKSGRGLALALNLSPEQLFYALNPASTFGFGGEGIKDSRDDQNMPADLLTLSHGAHGQTETAAMQLQER